MMATTTPVAGNGSTMEIPRSCVNNNQNPENLNAIHHHHHNKKDDDDHVGDSQDCKTRTTMPQEEEDPIIDIIINNVVCSFNTRCHLNLKKIAMEGLHVEYRRENGMLNMKLRKPYTTASIWSSGKVTCTGATSEDEAKLAARRFARRLQKLGFNVQFINFRVVNVLGTCSLPFGIKINLFSKQHPQNASYEPELHPGVTYKIKRLKATLKIFSTGSITVTAPCVANVQEAIEHIYPLLTDYKMEKRGTSDQEVLFKKYIYPHSPKHSVARPCVGSSSSEEDFDSDVSQD